MIKKTVARVERPAIRETLYDEEIHLPIIRKVMSSGIKTQAHVAAACGVSSNTLARWVKENPELGDEFSRGKAIGESELIDLLYKIGKGECKGNPTALALIANNCYGWRQGSANGGNGGDTYIQNNITLSYDQINNELQKYLDKMGVKNLTEFHDAASDRDD